MRRALQPDRPLELPVIPPFVLDDDVAIQGHGEVKQSLVRAVGPAPIETVNPLVTDLDRLVFAPGLVPPSPRPGCLVPPFLRPGCPVPQLDVRQERGLDPRHVEAARGGRGAGLRHHGLHELPACPGVMDVERVAVEQLAAEPRLHGELPTTPWQELELEGFFALVVQTF